MAESQGVITLIKILSMVVCLGVSLLFGLFPLFCVKFLGIANSFSGGVFLGIGLFHLLPEAAEGFEDIFKDSGSVMEHLPLAYFIAFLSYALILFIEKVAFDSHALVQHAHGDEEHGHSHGHDQENKGHNHDDGHSHSNKGETSIPLIKQNEKESGTEEDSEDEQEETIKNVISGRGKLASFLLTRNSVEHSNNVRKSMIEHPSESNMTVIQKTSESKSFINNRALRKASILLGNKKSMVDDEDKDLMVDNKIHMDGKVIGAPDALDVTEELVVKGGSITPYLLLLALSLHGFFEGVALGVQSSLSGVLKLVFAILAHKWAEAFTLGISFQKSNTEKSMFIKMITIFSMFTPLGILLGFFISSSRLVESIFLAISTGTFIYVACSEVIVEEFSITKYKWAKFLFFIIGGVFISMLSIIEALNGGHSHDDEVSHSH